MKKLIAVIIALLALWSISCEKRYGGPIPGGVYILEDNKLRSIHGSTFEMTSTTNSIDFQLISTGIKNLEILAKLNGISAELISDFSSEDAIVYDTLYTSTIAWPRYIQTIRINTDANSKKRSRKIKFRLHLQSHWMFSYADMTVQQNN